MKALSVFLLLFSSFGFTQAPEINPDKSYCDGNTTVVEIENPNDTVVSWYNIDEDYAYLGSGNQLKIHLKNDKVIAAIRGEDTTTFSLDSRKNGCYCQVYIPNHFTPDGDEFNNEFTPIFNCDIIAVNTFIYNRAGNLVYYSESLNPSWDGTYEENGIILSDGVYPYLVYYLDENGTQHKLVGHVLLLK